MKVDIIGGWLKPEEQIGELSITRSHGKEVVAVELDTRWCNNHAELFIDPDIAAYAGIQYPPNDKKMFGFLSDASPDRWGRKLIDREEKITADKEKRAIRTLNESDYLLGVSDRLRYGGIRFEDHNNGIYLSSSTTPIPPFAKLRMLEQAARGYEMSEKDDTLLKVILEPGSSLGGARPKANVVDEAGNLWIAKFPSKKDEYDIGAWEMVEHDLAKICGINVPDAKVMRLSEHGSTFLSKRFDRLPDGTRIHLMSAMTALGMIDGNNDGIGYLDIAGQLEMISADPQNDLQELWRRLAFNVLTSNCDDHLRNHGFILKKDGWHLSPAYDLNPVIGKDALSLNITDKDNRLNIDNVITVSEMFRISENDAKDIVEEMKTLIRKNLYSLSEKYYLPERSVKEMHTAFARCERT